MSIKILIVGPAGSGKTTLAKEMQSKGFKVAKLHTTRPKRHEQEDEYIFTNNGPSEEHRIKCCYNGWWYYMEAEAFESDVFVLGVKMAEQMREVCDELKIKTLTMCTWAEWVERYDRIRDRNMPGDTAYDRMARDRDEFSRFTDYDILIQR
jgi:hypothetical protein